MSSIDSLRVSVDATPFLRRLGLSLVLTAPGCMGMGPEDLTTDALTESISAGSNGSSSKTSGNTGTDSASSTSGGTTGVDTQSSGDTMTTDTASSGSSHTSTTTSSSTTAAETVGTTDAVTTGGTDTGAPCLEGIECNNGKCMNIDGVDQCVCYDLCYKGGASNCYDECAEGCYDKNKDPANPNCVQIDPDILPPPTFWGSKAFKAYQSQAPFFKEGMTDKQTQFLMVDIDGGLSQPIQIPTFDPNVPNWNGYWGGNDEHFVLPAYDGIPHQFCLRAVKKVVPSAPVCFDVVGSPN